MRENILAAALEYFATFGFEGTTTRAVAERAGVTHTLVIYHFKSKEQLWMSVMDMAVGGYVETVTKVVSTTSSPSEALKLFIETFVRMSAQSPHVHRIMTLEGNQESARLQQLIDKYLRGHFEMVRDLIRRGQLEGTVRECDPARLYFHILGAGGTPFATSHEYRELTGRDIFSEREILRTIAFIHDLVFC